MGYLTCAFIGIFLEKGSMFNEVVSKLEKISGIVECHYTTGQYAIFIKVRALDNDHLKLILNDKIQAIKGVSSTETYISLDEVFKNQLTVK